MYLYNNIDVNLLNIVIIFNKFIFLFSVANPPDRGIQDDTTVPSQTAALRSSSRDRNGENRKII